jgi:hypothetical protein
MRTFPSVFRLALPALLTFACSPEQPIDPLFTSEYEQDQARYIDKVARALRLGFGVTRDDPMKELIAMSPEELVDHFMKDPRFIDTILDFNLFYLGFRGNGIYTPEGYIDPVVLDSRRAVSAAIEMKNGGNYLKLLSLEQPLYVRGPETPPPIETGTTAEASANETFPTTDAGRRRWYYETALAQAQRVSEVIAAGGSFSEICGALLNPDYLIDFPQKMGLTPQELGWLLINDVEWYGLLFPACFARGSKIPVDQAGIDLLVQRTHQLYPFAESLAAVPKAPRSLDDLVELDFDALGLDGAKQLETTDFYERVLNSSTNFNRRRAAYMLDRFFCDDLQPINAALPEAHSEDRHAADPGCRACHYKLDPMAGFFRDYGFSGTYFGEKESIIFDDFAHTDIATYRTEWLAPADSGRTWNIGYIRSTEDESLNSYGESLEDLFAIIETAPEVKACLVRRTFQYFNGQQQLVDPGYLAHLTQLFTEEAAGNSSIAMKRLISRILTSETFRTLDPRSNECYDLAPGADAENRPPCGIAFTLRENCAMCHAGGAAAAGLDLTAWTKDADGRATFLHVSGGSQRSAEYIYTSILDRISTTDPNLSMPLGRTMSAKDREAIYLWINEQLDGSN